MAALRWLLMRANRPSPLEHYLMEIWAEVRRSWVKRPARVKSHKMRLKFVGADGSSLGGPSGNRRRRNPGMTKEQATLFSQTRWCMAAGMKWDKHRRTWIHNPAQQSR